MRAKSSRSSTPSGLGNAVNPATPLIVREQRTPGGTVRLRSTLGLRWVVLGFTCLVGVGSYYSYDNPAALEAQIHARFAHTPYGDNFAFSGVDHETAFQYAGTSSFPLPIRLFVFPFSMSVFPTGSPHARSVKEST